MLTIQIQRVHVAILAAMLLVTPLVACGETVNAPASARSTTTRYTAADVVAAFRSHGLAAVDPTPYAPAQPRWWYEGRPAGNYTIETVVVGTQASQGLYAGVVWVAPDDATATAVAEYVRDLRNMSGGGSVDLFQHYRHGNVVLMFNYSGSSGWGEFIQRYFLAFGTMP